MGRGHRIAVFTGVFAVGQTLGPLLTGALSDTARSLRLGLGAALAWRQPGGAG